MATYVIQRGDTLSKIGQKYGIPWQQIYNANKGAIGGNPNLIYSGTKLNIPGKGGGSAAPATGPTTQQGFENQAISQLEPYYKNLLAESQGDVNLAKARLKEDRSVFGEDLTLAFAESKKRLVSALNERGILFSGQRQEQLGTLTTAKERQNQAFERDLSRKSEDLDLNISKLRKSIEAEKPLEVQRLAREIRANKDAIKRSKDEEQLRKYG